MPGSFYLIETIRVELTKKVEGRLLKEIDLMIALLLRFPQIGTMHYIPKTMTVEIVFLLEELTAQEFEHFHELCNDHFDVYQRLTKRQFSIFNMELAKTDWLSAITFTRDLDSLTYGELGILMELVIRDLGKKIIIEDGEYLTDDFFCTTDLTELINAAKTDSSQDTLVGFRTKGRVMVFRDNGDDHDIHVVK